MHSLHKCNSNETRISYTTDSIGNWRSVGEEPTCRSWLAQKSLSKKMKIDVHVVWKKKKKQTETSTSWKLVHVANNASTAERRRFSREENRTM